MEDCPFCQIVEGRLPTVLAYKDRHVVAFAPLEKDALAPGHLLVVPRRHCAAIYDITKEELRHVSDAVQAIAERLRQDGAEGVNLLHASGRAAQQSVFHFHIHLIPRHEGDGLDLWPKADEERRRLASGARGRRRVRAAPSQLPSGADRAAVGGNYK